MKLQGTAISNVGMVRKHNEDSFFVDSDNELYVVADGVGGQNAGEVASRMAVELINDHLLKSRDHDEPFIGEYNDDYLDSSNRLASAIRLANRVVFESSHSNPALQGMGSTVVASTIEGNILCLAHVGDSRAYLLREGTITQLTDDHSLVSEQLKQGLITEEEAEKSTVKNVITRALGAKEDVDVDINEQDLQDGDRIVICSDGLCNMVSDEVILSIGSGKEKLVDICAKLIQTANDNGGKDNVTVAMMEARKKGLLWFLK
jgi:serine/threonine protein phosphatase PrpC